MCNWPKVDFTPPVQGLNLLGPQDRGGDSLSPQIPVLGLILFGPQDILSILLILSKPVLGLNLLGPQFPWRCSRLSRYGASSAAQ